MAKASGLQFWQHAQSLEREHAESADEVRGKRIAGEGVAVDHQDAVATLAQLQREAGPGHARADDHDIVVLNPCHALHSLPVLLIVRMFRGTPSRDRIRLRVASICTAGDTPLLPPGDWLHARPLRHDGGELRARVVG